MNNLNIISQRFLIKTIAFVLIILISIATAPTLANANTTSQQSQLNYISQQINSVKKTLAQKQALRNQLENALKSSEISIGQSEKQLHDTMSKLNNTLRQFRTSREKEEKYNALLLAQKKILLSYVRTVYMLGRQQYIKLLLNQQNPSNIDRHITYYHYLTRARLKIANKIKHTLDELQTTKNQVEKQTRKLEHIKAKQLKQNRKLEARRHHRQWLLHAINQSITTQKQRLEKLESNKKNLHHVIKHIQTEKYFYAPGDNFYQAQGKLPWPIRHIDVLQGYNEPLFHNYIRTSGVLLKAPEGTPIHAIFKGKIVFANWLRGYGLLAIVEHGKDFMTLYGHAQSLYVKLGQTVKPGQIIATVGNSGGYQQYALYFELRHDGDSLDPFRWLRRAT